MSEWYTVTLSNKNVDGHICGNSFRFTIVDADAYVGYSFFYPDKLVEVNKHGYDIRTKDEWSFTLQEGYRDTDGKWVITDTVDLNLEGLKELMTVIPLIHKPPYLAPVESVEVPAELVDDE